MKSNLILKRCVEMSVTAYMAVVWDERVIMRIYEFTCKYSTTIPFYLANINKNDDKNKNFDDL